jgi:hypothetical protein
VDEFNVVHYSADRGISHRLNGATWSYDCYGLWLYRLPIPVGRVGVFTCKWWLLYYTCFRGKRRGRRQTAHCDRAGSKYYYLLTNDRGALLVTTQGKGLFYIRLMRRRRQGSVSYSRRKSEPKHWLVWIPTQRAIQMHYGCQRRRYYLMDFFSSHCFSLISYLWI